MSTWITLHSDDLLPYLNAGQLDALRTQALGDGQPDPLPALIADIVERLRTEIRSAPANRLSQTPGSIPPELRGVAAALVIEAAQTRLPGLTLSADQVRAANAARHFMERVAKGEIPVSAPADPVPVAESSPVVRGHIQLVAARETQLRGHELRGL